MDGSRETLVEHCVRLVRISSPNPPGDTRDVAAYVRGELQRLKFEVATFAPYRDQPNIVASITGGRPGPHLVFNGHLDTFPPAEANPDPYGGRIAGGRIYGAGASDMKAGLAITLTIAEWLAEARAGIAGKVLLTYSSDEETGGSLGTAWLLRHVHQLAIADAGFVLDQSGADQFAVGEKGACWVRLRTSGSGGHAAYREHANAIEGLVAVLQQVLSLRSHESCQVPSTVESSDAARRVTVNLGRINGGLSPNLIATSASADVDVRIPFGETTAWALSALRSAIANSGIACDLDVVLLSEPTLTDPRSPLVDVLHRHVEGRLGRAVRPMIRVGASDARLFRRAGVPTVVYGPTAHGLGTAGENVEIDEMEMITGVYADFLSEVLNIQ